MDIGVFSSMPSSAADPAIVAKRAEELGFESYWVPDHPILPVDGEKDYPGLTADNAESVRYLLSHIPDPLMALARAGAVTTTLKLGTGVYLVPERNPIISAQQIATLDDAVQGRFLFGIGAGWNEAECVMLGGDFAHRWGQTKDFIASMRALWQDGESEYSGKYIVFSPVHCYPKPARKEGPPVLLGGITSPYVYRRVAEWGDGWAPLVPDISAFEAGMDKLKQACDGAGRDMNSLDLTVFGMTGQWRTADDVSALENAGANRTTIWLNATATEDIVTEMEALARELL